MWTRSVKKIQYTQYVTSKRHKKHQTRVKESKTKMGQLLVLMAVLVVK